MNNRFPSRVLQTSFSSLKHRNFRLFWLGQCVSLIGTWMQNIGQSWLVLQLTHSPLKLSIVTMIQFLPMMLFSLYAGTLIDRFSKRKILIFTQTSMLLLATALATLTYFNVVQYWHVLILALLLGIVNTIDMPTRQSFFVELVGKEDLMNAIALNSSIFNLARIIGPAIAGILIGLVGIAICFYLNALSFVAVIIGIWMIKVPAHVKSEHRFGSIKEINSDVAEGLRYINSKLIIKVPLLLLALLSLFVMNYNVLLPIFAETTLGQGATGYGFLMATMGVGSFIGAMSLAIKSRSGPSLKYLVGGALGASLFMSILGLQANFILSSIILFIIGLCSITFTALVNSTIQLNSADHMRGRVMSVYSLVFGGVVPIGSLFAGTVTEYFGAPGCMIISGVIGIVVTAYVIYVLRKHKSEIDSPILQP